MVNFIDRNGEKTGKKIIFMYSGQGSQYYMMGADLYAGEPRFRYWMQYLDRIVIDFAGFSIVDILYHQGHKYSEPFNRTLYTHPAIFMVGYALSQVLLEKGYIPDYLLGASLGEYITLAVAGYYKPEDMLKMLINSAKLMEDECQKGGMTAIFAEKQVFASEPGTFKKITFAADNFDGHFVVSGGTNDLEKMEHQLSEKNILFQKLPVSIAFHSPLIDNLKEAVKAGIGELEIRRGHYPTVSCAYRMISPEINASYLWDIARTPVNFRDTISMMEEKDDFIYVDLGSSGTLSGFARKCLGNADKSYSIMTIFGNNDSKIKQIEKVFIANHQIKQVSTDKAMHTKKAFIFPGQGSQSKGMGKDLFEEFDALTQKADQVLGYSIKRLCLEDPGDQLVQTQYAQVAIFFINALHYYKKIASGEKPDFVAGHSLGEFNALLAAGAFDFETGLKLVQQRGLIMAKATGGGMAAIIGMDEEQIHAVISTNQLEDLDIANLNSPHQIVISGPNVQVTMARPYFEKAGAQLFIPLKVSGAFHSRSMKDSAVEFSNYMSQYQFNKLEIPVISNVSARPYLENSVKDNLTLQIDNPVKWTESVRYLMGKNVTEFIEIGEGNVLKGLVNKIKKEAEPLIVTDEPEVLHHNGAAKAVNAVLNGGAVTVKVPVKEPVVSVEKNHDNSRAQRIIKSSDLGSAAYKKAYRVTYAYAAGAMYRGISSANLVIAMGRAGMMSYFGSSGLPADIIEEKIKLIKSSLTDGAAFGINMVYDLYRPKAEEVNIELYLKYGIINIEVSGYLQITKSLVKFRAKGLSKKTDGTIVSGHRIQVKLSRPEVAELFFSPAPGHLVDTLLADNEITAEQAELIKQVPVATDVCIEADPGGATEKGAIGILIPTIGRLRDQFVTKYNYREHINLGAAGGIGTPEAAAAAFLLGADFIVTGSINQCTVEAATSDSVKNLIENINIQDTDYAPASDMFEWGAKVQVLKKGVFFPARANKLFDLYKQFNSLDEIDENSKNRLEQKYFKKSLIDIFEECRLIYPENEYRKAEENPKIKMGMVFKWYLEKSTEFALSGDESGRINYQVYCGPALGAFNQWIKGTDLEKWQHRNVDKIAIKLLNEAADFINNKLTTF